MDHILAACLPSHRRHRVTCSGLPILALMNQGGSLRSPPLRSVSSLAALAAGRSSPRRWGHGIERKTQRPGKSGPSPLQPAEADYSLKVDSYQAVGVQSSISTSASQARALRLVLDQLFPAQSLAWLQRHRPRHPVNESIRLLEKLEAQEVLDYDEEISIQRNLASLTLNASTWARAREAGHEVEADAWRQVQTRVLDGDQFPNALAELHVWGSLRTRTLLTAELSQESGAPDLQLIDGQRFGVAEIKAVRRGWSGSSVGNSLKKANKQIRNATPEQAGTLFVVLERDPDRASLDDGIPADVGSLVTLYKSLLRPGFFRSVGTIIVIWDEFQVVGSVAETGAVFTFRRKSLEIHHPAPKQENPIAVDPDAMTAVHQVTTTYRVEPSRVHWPAINLGNLSFASEFRQFDEEVFGVRPAHVIDAIQTPTARADIRQPDGETMSLITRAVTQPNRPYTLLLVIFSSRDGPTLVHNAFKIFAKADTPANTDPIGCFMWFLEQFGSDVSVGPLSGRFLHEVRVEGEGDLQILGIGTRKDLQEREQIAAVGFFELRSEPIRHVIVRFAFAVAYRRYKSAYFRNNRRSSRSGNPAVRALAIPPRARRPR